MWHVTLKWNKKHWQNYWSDTNCTVVVQLLLLFFVKMPLALMNQISCSIMAGTKLAFSRASIWKGHYSYFLPVETIIKSNWERKRYVGGWKTVGLEKTRHKCWQVAREGVLTLEQLVHHGELQQRSLPWKPTFGAGEDAYRQPPHVGWKRQEPLQ